MVISMDLQRIEKMEDVVIIRSDIKKKRRL
jgi:23S rRNA U2552 (ribose-2'-O)-methylase RlmE/FtsJ